MPALERTSLSVTDFLAASRGSCVALDSLLYFHTTAGLTGYVLWQDPSQEDLAALAKILDASIDLEAHPSMIDGRELQAPPLRLFTFMAEFFPDRRDRFQRAVERLALVRAPDVVGAVALGFFEIITPPYPIKAFGDLTSALEWLGQPSPGEIAGDLEERVAAARGVPTLIHRLRLQIEAALSRPDMAEIASRLNVSERTLHRRLTELGTSFADEVGRARVTAAKTLLRDTDTPITTIAIDIGCASAASFSVLFRKLEGMTPTEWRKARR